MTGGAAVTVITKSGTNYFRGSAFAMHDNSAMRAFTWDENRAGVKDKPDGKRNIDGGSLGGPIKKNKLFFFAQLGRHVRTREQFACAHLFRRPTSGAGDFSRMLGAPILSAAGNPILVPTTEGGTTPLREGMIFDPFTGNLDGTGRSVFSSGGRVNVIPQARLNAPMMKMMALVPHAESVWRYAQLLQYRHADAEPEQLRRQDQLEPQRAASAVLQVQRDGRARARRLQPRRRRRKLLVRGGGLGTGSTLVQIAGIGQTYTVSPTFLIDGTFGWTRFGQDVEPPDLGTNFGLDVLGIPGTNGPDPRESGMPPMYISGYSDAGESRGLESRSTGTTSRTPSTPTQAG